jgi:hypothetical protein
MSFKNYKCTHFDKTKIIPYACNLLFLVEIYPKFEGENLAEKLFRPKWSFVKSTPDLAAPDLRVRRRHADRKWRLPHAR